MHARPEWKRPDDDTVMFRRFYEKQNKITGRVGGACSDV
jgi:hypothetical protein